ncbi:MAG: hypothetical protein BWK78_02000 [Thiotrichaceae bacterium IS1]|nr:MAG: hypothetical protein BWK78_02000 [Thiotrichaceae bacterium IS1]
MIQKKFFGSSLREQESPMKIVELGYSGVGKTTYMASMYGTLQEGFGGFKLRTIDHAEHTRLLGLYASIKAGNYPPATSQRNEYDFYLQHGGKDIFQFTWADYRGKAIRETSDSYEAQRLHQDICSADGIMIFFDCKALIKGDAKANEIRRVTALMNKAFQDLNQPISLAIVLTKIDLVEKENFKSGLLEPLKGLIEVVETSNMVSGTLIPVACGIKMINTQMPVLFALQTRVRSTVNMLNEEYKKYASEAESCEEEARKEQKLASGLGGFFRDLGRSILSETTHAELARRNWREAEEKKEKAQAKLAEWQPLSQPANDLNYYTKRLINIRKGETLHNYVTQLKRFEGGGQSFIFIFFLIVVAIIILIAVYSK